MVLQRWDPFVEMRSMEDAINRMWRGLGQRPAQANGGEHWATSPSTWCRRETTSSSTPPCQASIRTTSRSTSRTAC